MKTTRRNFIKSVSIVGSLIASGATLNNSQKKENQTKGIFTFTQFSNNTFGYHSISRSYSDNPSFNIDKSDIKDVDHIRLQYLNTSTKFQRLKVLSGDRVIYDVFVPPNEQVYPDIDRRWIQ
jgi:hypothetical protein